MGLTNHSFDSLSNITQPSQLKRPNLYLLPTSHRQTIIKEKVRFKKLKLLFAYLEKPSPMPLKIPFSLGETLDEGV